MTDVFVTFENSSGLIRIGRPSGAELDKSDRVWARLSAASLGSGHRGHVGASELVMPWVTFLEAAKVLHHASLRDGLDVHYEAGVEARLARWVEDTNSVQSPAAPWPEREVERGLEASGWDLSKRVLTAEQRRDVAKVLSRPNAAIFSVPGAGKTTVALATHQIWASKPADPMLLVVAPLNAFAAWDEVVADCLLGDEASVVRLVGGAAAVREAIGQRPRYAVISYGQLPNAASHVMACLLDRDVHLILDESHKIKAGADGIQAREVLRLAPFAQRRDILSGTPMPQSQSDLVSQFEFLYPASGLSSRIEQAARVQHVIAPLFARTKYNELGVPTPEVDYLPIDMSEPQRLLYATLRDDVLKAKARQRGSRELPRAAVTRLLYMAIDAQGAAERLLLLDEYSRGSARELCEMVVSQGLCPRLERAAELVRSWVTNGEKVVVWAPFTSTVKTLSRELSDLGAREYFGDTPAGDVEELGTREQIIREFHDSDTCNVLIANPAAGSEGISLHRVCHRALYVGRTYNATHYLQSRDRINRLGMPPNVTTKMTVLESTAPQRVGSVDLSVRRRLDLKVNQLAEALDDNDLQAIALESDGADRTLDDGFTLHDLLDLFDELGA